MGPIGVEEMIGIFIVALLLFGPKKLPELGRTLGKAISEFRRAKNELKTTFEGHLRELERETRIADHLKIEDEPRYGSSSGPDYSSPSYPYSHETPPRDDAEYLKFPNPQEQPQIASPIGDGYPSEPGAHYAEEQREAAPAVEGVVPRSNGARPVETVHAVVEEEHPA